MLLYWLSCFKRVCFRVTLIPKNVSDKKGHWDRGRHACDRVSVFDMVTLGQRPCQYTRHFHSQRTNPGKGFVDVPSFSHPLPPCI